MPIPRLSRTTPRPPPVPIVDAGPARPVAVPFEKPKPAPTSLHVPFTPPMKELAAVSQRGTDYVNTAGQPSAAERLLAAGRNAAAIPAGPERAQRFARDVLPVLLEDAARLLGADAALLAGVLAQAVAASTVDPEQPPRSANAAWPAFAAALGISRDDAAAVTALNARIGSAPKADGKYAPAIEQLSPDLQALAKRATRFLLGETAKPLTATERAFAAGLVLNNLTWHMTNWQRAAADPTRADPQARNNVFNTYSDNLAAAQARAGLGAAIDMAISDAYNAGKATSP